MSYTNGMSTVEARLRVLESYMKDVLFNQRQFQAELGSVRQMAANSGGGQTPFNTDPGYIALTPVGGIPAASGTGFGATLGSAVCTIGKVVAGVTSSDGFTKTVYNISTSAVSGSKVVAISVRSGVYVCDLEPC